MLFSVETEVRLGQRLQRRPSCSHSAPLSPSSAGAAGLLRVALGVDGDSCVFKQLGADWAGATLKKNNTRPTQHQMNY